LVIEDWKARARRNRNPTEDVTVLETDSMTESPSFPLCTRLARYALPVALVFVPQLLFAQSSGQFEKPPVVNASRLLPAAALSGPGFHVERLVPTNGAMGRYTLVFDRAVFHEDAGTYSVESLNLLKIRLSEIPAIRKLEDVSKTAVFANALAASAERPVQMGAEIVAHPLDTVSGLPSGIGEFFGRVSLGAGTLLSTVTNSSESGGQRASQTAGETANITLTALGYDDVRRQLAKKLNVDPYTTNPILKEKLNSVAWVMFSARLAVNTVVSVAVPGSMIITGVEFTNDLVYQTPKGDLILLVEKKLQNMGLSQAEIAAFSHNTAIPLSLQVAAVTDLESLGDIPGRRAVAVALGNVLTEYQARFMVTSIRMLAQWSQKKSPITAIGAPGVLIARDQNNTVIMPAPVDYVSWTPRIAGFVTTAPLLSLQNRTLWIPAGMTPLARRQLTANGWTVHEHAQP
jgi:hypothetical protein